MAVSREVSDAVPQEVTEVSTVRKRLSLVPNFFHRPENPNSYGLISDLYTQPEDLGLSSDAVREARQTKALKDRVIVVVGAGLNGIGGASVIEAATEGATLVGVSRKPTDHPDVRILMEMASDISGSRSLWIPADVTEDASSRKILDTTISEFGRIDGMVIAPAAINDKQYTDYTREEFDDLFKTNFDAANWLMQDALVQMKDQKEGKITFVSSISAAGTPGQAPYAAAKAAMEAIIRGLPLELIRFRGKVAVNALASGFVSETGLTGKIEESGQKRILEFSCADRPLLAGEAAEGIIHLLNPNTVANGKVVPMVGRGPVPPINIFGIPIR